VRRKLEAEREMEPREPNAPLSRQKPDGVRVTLVIPIYAAWLLPAVLGLVMDWSAWVVLVLLTPGVIWYAVTVGMRYYKEAHRANPALPTASRIPMLVTLPLLIAVAWNPSRYSGILVVVGLIAIDLISRLRREKMQV
jgi:hypothetical protein